MSLSKARMNESGHATFKANTRWLASQITKQFMLLFAIVVSVQIVYHFSGIGRDSTDVPDTLSRSGLKPLVDNMTGCQYLETKHGVTPRLDSTGVPMCGEE